MNADRNDSAHGIYFQVMGRGTPLLLLRGWGRSCRYWLGFDEELAKSYRIIVMDYRCVGRSGRSLKWTDSIHELATDALDVLNHLDISTCNVFGLSIGGMVAMALAERHPQRVGRMIIANSSIAFQSPRRINLYPLTKLLLSRVSGGDFLRNLVDLLVGVTADEGLRAKTCVDWKNIMAIEPMRFKPHIVQLLAALRYSPDIRLAQLKEQILVVHGENDLLVPGENSKIIADRLGPAPLLTVPGGGHELPADSREFLTQLIKGFIK